MTAMRDVCVYVIGHKPFPVFAGEGYETLQVGPGEPFSALRDDTGDNIADRNGTYCELTGLYWAWKNGNDSRFLGLVHYRRYFIAHRAGSRSFREDILTKEEILQRMEQCDVIVQEPSFKNPTHSDVLYEGAPDNKHKSAILVLRGIIRDFFPQDLAAYDDVACGYLMYHANMFIAGREIFLDYCAWLFQVLEEFERRYTAIGEEIWPRQIGYIGEYLLTVYMHSRIPKERLCFCRSAMITEQKDPGKIPIPYPVKNVLRSAFRPLVKKAQFHRAASVYARKRREHGLPVDPDILRGRKYSVL